MKLFGMNIVEAILYSNFLCILNKETLILSRNLNFYQPFTFCFISFGIFILRYISIIYYICITGDPVKPSQTHCDLILNDETKHISTNY